MRMQDELASTISKVDRVKQLLLFPAVEGYRFRAGSGRVFLGSKDLFVSELAASFHFSCHRAVGSDGRPKVRHSLASMHCTPASVAVTCPFLPTHVPLASAKLLLSYAPTNQHVIQTATAARLFPLF